MGAGNENRVSGTDTELKGSSNTKNTGAVGTADRNSVTESTGAGNTGAGRSGNTGAGAGTAEKAKTEVSRLADVTESAPIPEAPKKKTRRKKPAKKKQDIAPAFDSTQITALLVSFSAVIASRPNLHMFALSEMEAEQIASPLSNIIAKSDKLSGVGEHADAIALVSACLIIMLPRVMMYFDTVKQKKIEANGGVKIADNRNNKKAESAGDNRKVTGNTSAVNPFNANGISSAIPAIV